MPGLQIECARTSPYAKNSQPNFQQPEALRMQKIPVEVGCSNPPTINCVIWELTDQGPVVRKD